MRYVHARRVMPMILAVEVTIHLGQYGWNAVASLLCALQGIRLCLKSRTTNTLYGRTSVTDQKDVKDAVVFIDQLLSWCKEVNPSLLVRTPSFMKSRFFY